MNWKSFFLGALAGIAGGYMLKEAIASKSYLSPDKVLTQVKEKFKQDGPISGSWIQMTAEPYDKGQVHYTVYKGGISKRGKDGTEQYEFVADASTGTVLDIHPLTV